MNPSQYPLTSLLIKPSGPDCNLNCEYCFYLPKSKLYPGTPRHRMKENTLKEILRQALSQCDQGISISWQGGEPTLMGLEFYKKAVEFQIAFGQGKTIGNGFQTNGILLNRKWAAFFKKYAFLVGLSIDGPRHIHDHYRRFSKNKGSWDRVHTNAKMLLDRGVSVNAMTCLTNYSARFPEEIYTFHKTLGLAYMQFIPVIEWDKTGSLLAAPFSVTADQYGAFLCRVFDLWLSDFKGGRPTTSIRLFESVFFSCMGYPSSQCTFQEACGQYLVVEHNGDVYPCDFFVEPEWKLGNVMQGRLETMLNSEKQAEFRSLKKKVAPNCKSCSFRLYCHGGCTKDRAFGAGSVRQNYFCDAYTKFFEHALPVLKNLADSWQPDGIS